jgi:hypothetical protein
LSSEVTPRQPSILFYFSREAAPLLCIVFRSSLVFHPLFSPRRPVSLEGHAVEVPVFAPQESLLRPKNCATGSSVQACRLLVWFFNSEQSPPVFRLVLLGSFPVLGLWESRHDTAVEAQLSPFSTPSVSVVPRAAGGRPCSIALVSRVSGCNRFNRFLSKAHHSVSPVIYFSFNCSS